MKISFNWLKELVDLPRGVTEGAVAERLTLAGGLDRSVARLALVRLDHLRVRHRRRRQVVRQRHPAASDAEMRKRFTALTLGRDVSIELFNWDPHLEGW